MFEQIKALSTKQKIAVGAYFASLVVICLISCIPFAWFVVSEIDAKIQRDREAAF